ncbi:hypothetical protein ACQ859_18035 [Roseateles chitinivorans]|uniref:hypothetical protein n=1 Tax=Roseateles chitinivorans TaxID=2917965 RepID=UPI003D6650C1
MQDPAPIDLDALYAPPSDMIQKAVLDRLVDFHRDDLAKATFFCLSTGSKRGLDASPRGGPPGVLIDEVLMHCGKAVHRAHLWQPEPRLDRHSLPSVGRIISDVNRLRETGELGAAEIAQIDAHYSHAVRTDLYGTP